MDTNIKKIRLVVSVALQDAGEATRSLEIAKGLRENIPLGYELEIIFLSHGSKFESKVINNGFSVYKVQPELEGKGPHIDLKIGKNNFIGDPELAFQLLNGEYEALNELQPDFIIHGFWPFASIARRMLKKKVYGICFLPIPMERSMYGGLLMKDVPDAMKVLTYLPRPVRSFIFRAIPDKVKLKAPILKQANILDAAKRFGWQGKPFNDLFDILQADFTIVNDMKRFYHNAPLPKNYKVVGPLYSPGDMDSDVDPEILRLFKNEEKKLNIFCTLGSSGTKDVLIEAIKAIASEGDRWNAVVLAPPSVCPLDEAVSYTKGLKNIYVTDKFVLAPFINKMANVVISHGGQGTVQTAIAAGTPIVGMAMQPEQQINLDNVVFAGGAIRIPKHRWKAKAVNKAVKKIASDCSFCRCMSDLKLDMDGVDGKKGSALALWRFMCENYK